MDFSHINWLAAVAAGLSAFLVGGIWYSKALFGNAWMTDSNLTTEQIQAGNKGKIFGFTAVFSLIMAANLAIFLSDAKTDVAWGAEGGAVEEADDADYDKRGADRGGVEAGWAGSVHRRRL